MTNFAKTRAMLDIPEGMIYLNGNSLGPMPKAGPDAMMRFMNEEWRTELIKGWNTKGWFMQTNTIGDRIGKLIGAPKDSVVVSDTLSIKVFQAVGAGLALVPDRKLILSDTGNFPTDLYMVQGLVKLKEDGYKLRTVAPAAVLDAITDEVAVVTLTEVDYRTGRKHDMKAIIDKAHSVGAVVVWDLAHSAGAIPVDVLGTDVDFAVGCTYKFFNAGPGGPAFIYVAPRLIETVEPVLSGWYGHEAPFAFDTDYRPMPGKIDRMRIGTPSIASFAILEAALDIWEDVDLNDVRTRSIELMELFIHEVESRCDGVTLAGPRNMDERGSHVSFEFEHGYPCMQALIERKVIGDFRAPDILRFGFASPYVRYIDIWDSIAHLRDVMEMREWDQPKFKERRAVT